MRVGLVIPSYFNDSWEKFITRQRDSLKYLKEIDNLVFLVNWQNMPEDSHVSQIINSYLETVVSLNPTWEYKCLFKEKYSPVSMCRIRNDLMLLDTSCDLYLFLDDDVYFKEKSPETYLFAINSFEEDPTLGVVMCAGYLGGYNYVNKLRYDPAKFYMTNRGLFLRNISRCPESPIYPPEVLQYHRGGYEETIACMEIFKANYRLATAFNSSTMHPSISKMDKDSSDEVHDADTSQESLERYIAETFGLETKIRSADDIRKTMKSLCKMGFGYQD